MQLQQNLVRLRLEQVQNANITNAVAIGMASETDKEGIAYKGKEILGNTYTWGWWCIG